MKRAALQIVPLLQVIEWLQRNDEDGIFSYGAYVAFGESELNEAQTRCYAEVIFDAIEVKQNLCLLMPNFRGE